MSQPPTKDAPKPARRPLSTSAAVAAISGATYVSLGFGLVRGMLYMRALTPTQLGIVQLVFLFTRYFGDPVQCIFHGLTKRVPMLLGRGEATEADRLERAGVTATVLYGLFAASLLGAYALVGPSLGAETRMALAIGGIYMAFMQLSSAFRVVMRAHQRFRLIAYATILESLVLLPLVVAGAHVLGAPGTMVGWAVGMGAICLFVVYLRAVPGTPRFDVTRTTGLVKTGLPLLAVGLADTFLRTADKVVVAKVLGTHWLGFYGMAWQLSSYLYNVPGAIGDVLMPKILQAHGEGGDAATRDSVVLATRAIGYLMPILAGVGAIAGPVLVRLVLHKYEQAIPPLEVLLMATVFLSAPTALRPTLIAKNRELEMVLWSVLGGLLCGGLVWWLAASGAPLVQLAVGAAAGWLLGGTALTWRGLRLLGVGRSRTAGILLDLAWPFLYGVGLMGLAKYVTRHVFALPSLLISDLVALPIFLLLSSPLLWYANRSTGILGRIARRG